MILEELDLDWAFDKIEEDSRDNKVKVLEFCDIFFSFEIKLLGKWSQIVNSLDTWARPKFV